MGLDLLFSELLRLLTIVSRDLVLDESEIALRHVVIHLSK